MTKQAKNTHIFPEKKKQKNNENETESFRTGTKVTDIVSSEMASLLSDAFKTQLEQWIGTGPKEFKLLYSISKDGCNATTFHQKCDNKGPTVTVLYNPQGSIYGGYTMMNWATGRHGNYETDATAFMFRLQINGSVAVCKFPCIKHANAIYQSNSNGPVFGAGHDLNTFSGSITKSGDTFGLNSSMSMNNTYNTQGINIQDINNNDKSVRDLEVYQVEAAAGKQSTGSTILDMPWRETPAWNIELLHELKSEVEAFSPPRALKVTQSKVLIIGPVGAGKSSFFNTIASVFRGYVSTDQAASGSAEQSITSQYRMYQILSTETGKPLNFRLCDTRGLEENQGIDANDMSYLLDGNVPDKYQFNPSVPITPEVPGFKKNATFNDRIHCVCIVIDGSTAGVLPEKILEKIKAIQAKIRQRGVPLKIVLTKIDKICCKVDEDTSQVFKSSAIKQQVEDVSQLLGIPRNHVLLVKNYESEIEPKQNINILALMTLRHMLRATRDYMFNFLEEVDSERAPVLSSKD